jgi:hypothetical protein
MRHVLLLTLLIGSTVILPTPISAADPTPDEAKAIAEIRRLGGKVEVDEWSLRKPVIRVDLSRTKVNDPVVEHPGGGASQAPKESLGSGSCAIS